MTPQAQPLDVGERTSSRARFSVSVHGIVAGLIGATTLAVWFLWLDWWGRGRPLFTPTVLGLAVFSGGRGLESIDTLEPSLPMTLAFTAVHGIVFMVLGIVAARLVALAQQRHHPVLIILLMFIALQIAFVAFRLTFAAVTADAVEWPEIAFGNAFAATLMINYLWRRRPMPPSEG